MAVTRVVMPKLSEAMETGRIIKWLKKEGDPVRGGDILAEIETDKADVEMEAFGAGVLRKIVVPAGERVPIGALIGVIADPAEDIAGVLAEAGSGAPRSEAAPAPGGERLSDAAAAMASPVARSAEVSERPAAVPPQPRREDHAGRSPAPEKGPAAPARAVAPAPAAEVPAARPAGAATPGGGRVKASPLARKIAAQAGVNLQLIQGSGPGGRIVRRDVEAAASRPVPAAAEAAPAAAGPEYEDRPLSPIRATIARRMPQSKAPVPHFYVTSEVSMDAAWGLREQLNGLEGQPRISVNDLVIRACALALLRHPGINASFQGESIRVWNRVHVGIAVALDEGLITPVLRDCHARSLAQIAAGAHDLVERTRTRKLRANELGGATFSVSNLGMYDVADFSAIINPPEAAILAVGSVRRLPVVDGERVIAARRMSLTLSCDHRVIDGAMGARFLQDVKRLLEEPLRLLV
jgi:pyruvate dehydrogenase E2 component (dihydrolipoamide acetyltransferase)